MADKKVISDMIMYFSRIYEKKIDDDLVDAYYRLLKKYPHIQVREAAYQCLEELNRFPKPAEIIARIKSKQGDSVNEEFIILVDTRCRQCGSVKTCIKEPKDIGSWTCRQCYTGLTPEEHTAKFREILRVAFG